MSSQLANDQTSCACGSSRTGSNSHVCKGRQTVYFDRRKVLANLLCSSSSRRRQTNRQPPNKTRSTCCGRWHRGDLRMFLVGLTGGKASGKSTALDAFRKLGAPVIDTDQIARDVVQPGQHAWKKIRNQFGETVFLSDGQLDQVALGQEVCSDANKRQQLDAITQPEIHRVMVLQLFLCFLKGCQFVVVDLPFLFETRNMISFLSYVVVVSCTVDQQLQRLVKRGKMSGGDAEARIKMQMALEEKCRRATFIVDNSGTQDMTHKQILDLNQRLQRSTAHWPLRVCGWALLTVLTWTVLKVVLLLW